MTEPAKKLEQDPAEFEPEGQYDEKLFEDIEFEDGDETPEGAEGFDGEQSDESTEEQPEGKAAEEAEEPDAKAEDGDDEEEGNEQDQDEEQGPDLPPWVEAIPEDQRDAAVTELLQMHQAHGRLEEKYKSVRGHLAPTQRKLDRLQKTLEKFAATADAGGDIEASKSELLNFIEKHAEDFPLEAEQFKKAFEAYANRVEPDAKQYRKTLTQDDDDVDRAKELERLERAEPDAAQVNSDPRFKAFLKANPEYQQQAKSPFAHDAADVIEAFRSSTGWAPPRRSEEFLHVNQMIASDLLPGWAHAIGMSKEQIAQMDDVSKAKVFHAFKKDLDAAYQDDPDDDSDDDDEKADDEEALRLAKQRRQRKQDRSPKAKKTGADGGLSNLEGEALFEALDVGD